MRKERIFSVVLTTMIGLFGIVYLQTTALAQQAECAAAPKEKGVYFLQEGKWFALQAVSVSGNYAKGDLNAAKLMIPGGALFGMHPKPVLVFKDANAPVQINSAVSLFCIVGRADVNPRDIQVVKVTSKKDHRELQLSTKGLGSYRPEDVISSQSQSESESVIAVRIMQKPNTGEYILFAPPNGNTTSPGLGGYDFGVSN